MIAAMTLLAVAVSGCAYPIERMPVPETLVTKATIPGLGHVRVWGDETPRDVVQYVRTYFPNAGRSTVRREGAGREDYLLLSGGAGDGAFGAGVLSGWSRRGTRPQFAVVTGVSAGALIAPFAFLGPAYDRQLKELWTKYETKDLVITHLFTGILTGEALADTTPLRNLIAKYITREFVDRVGAEYSRGRVLLIGTTNLDAQRPVMWNMGEIALVRTPDALQLFRDVLMASASIPGAFPPVRINVMAGGKAGDEMHVDGGTTRQLFLAPGDLMLSALNRLYPTPPVRRVFVIKNGKLGPEYEAVKAQTVAISSRALFTTTKSQSLGDLARIRTNARSSGAQFSVMSIPSSFDVPYKEAFDRTYMQALFKVGVAQGMSGAQWMSRVPEGAPPPKPPQSKPMLLPPPKTRAVARAGAG